MPRGVYDRSQARKPRGKAPRAWDLAITSIPTEGVDTLIQSADLGELAQILIETFDEATRADIAGQILDRRVKRFLTEPATAGDPFNHVPLFVRPQPVTEDPDAEARNEPA